jgi:putative ABC transport system permease protein
MACCILIALYIQDEMRYDRFHEHGGRIYRVLWDNVGGEISPKVEERTPGPLGPALKRDFPEVEQTVRRMGLTAKIWVRHQDRVFDLVFRTVDPNFLDVFTFPLVKGDRSSVLRDPQTVVMTESAARRFFGGADPIGKVITGEDAFFEGDYRVTGILKDIPSNSSLQFDMLTSKVSAGFRRAWENWQGVGSWRPIQTYVLLAKGQSAQQLERKLPAFMERYMGKEAATRLAFHLQPLHRVHLYSTVDFGMVHDAWERPYGDIQRVRLFGAIAGLILLIACINYTNLVTARSVGRAKEVGVRQVMGAYRSQLIRQFLMESVLLACLSLCLGLVLAEAFLPALNAFTGKALSLGSATGTSALSLGIFALLVGLLAGGYPAFVLSAFQPIEAMKGKMRAGFKGLWLRRGLVVFQFATTVILIVSTVVVYRQLNYIKSRRLGYNPELLVTMPIFGMDRKMHRDVDDYLAWRYSTVKQAFLKHPGVLKASGLRWDMGPEGGGMLQTVRVEGVDLPVRVQEADEDYLGAYEIPLLAGRNFSLSRPSELDNGFILNETAVKLLGWQDPLGKTLEWGGRKGPVIGVMKDTHDRSLREKVVPTVFVYRLYNFWSLCVRVRAENIPETLKFLERQWKAFLPTRPFMYSFVDEDLARLYEAENRLGRTSGTFSLLAVFLACLGLFGLISFTAEQRTKEIGIRKALGASVSDIVRLLSKEFVKLVLVANLIAWPFAYYVTTRWLQGFAYRTSPGVGIFLLGGVLSLVVTLLVVSGQAARAARANPVDALRYE